MPLATSASIPDSTSHASPTPRLRDVQLPESLSVAGAAAVVHLEHERATRRPQVGGVVPGVDGLRTVDAGRATVNHAEQRVLLRRVVVARLDQHALDHFAVLALPADDLARAERPGRQSRRARGQHLRDEARDDGRVHLRQRGRRPRHVGQRRDPSALNDAPCISRASGIETRVIVPAAGSTRNRCDAVFWSAVT